MKSQFGELLDHQPLPRGLTSSEVRPYWEGMYHEAQEDMAAMKGSLYDRLGVHRHAATINRREIRTAVDLSRYDRYGDPPPLSQ